MVKLVDASVWWDKGFEVTRKIVRNNIESKHEIYMSKKFFKKKTIFVSY